MFGLRERDLGRRLQDLELSYRPLDLRSRIDQAQSSRTSVIARDVQRSLADGAIQSLDITVIPLPLNADGASPGTSILVADVTEYKRVQTDLVTSKQELETAYEELQSSNEELETTNEELQSTVEELETTNEEFQSANEELETMNEELQSTNGELQTVNWELRQRTDELNRISGFMESILGSLHMGLIVVDAEARVQVWNAASQELWGLRSEEVHGHELGSLDIGLPVGDLGEPIAKTLENGDSSELQLRATNRRGRALDFRVLVSPLGDRDGDGTSRGAIVLVEPVRASR